MREPSPYAGKTVDLRADALEVGGQPAEILGWYADQQLDAGIAAAKEQDYAIRAGRAGLPDDGDTLYARVDGMMRIVHVTEINGYAPPATSVTSGPLEARDVGATCPACEQLINGGDMVSILVLGPGGDREARAKARAGEPYDAAAIEVHWACRTGDESYDNGIGG